MTCSQQSENDSRMSVGNMLICFEQFNKKRAEMEVSKIDFEEQ